MRFHVVLNSIGIILKYFGILLLLPVIFAIAYKETSHILPFLVSLAVTIILGFLCTIKKTDVKELNDIKKSEALGIVFFAWLLIGFICTIPYLMYNLSFVDSIFESFSGITTTGATIITNFSIYPKTLFFYRSLTQWIGGMGIIVLFIGVLPQFAVAGRQMFFAESPGPVEEKLTPRIRQTAIRLWAIYGGLTLLQTALLMLIGKTSFYHAICIAFSTLSSGGFAYDEYGIALFTNYKIHWIITTFMFLTGCNYVLLYKAFIQRKFQSFIKNEEFRVYLGVICIASLVIAGILTSSQNISLYVAITNAFFTVTSAITSTGSVDVNYNLYWGITAKTILFAVMLIGGCATSTSGGIKVTRWIFIFKYLKGEIVKIIHPNAVTPIKISGSTIQQNIVHQMLAFVCFYVAVMGISSFIVCLIEKDFIISLFGTVTTLGNIGLTMGHALSSHNGFSGLTNATKLIFSFNMLIGRLELIPFLALLHPDAWKKS